METKKSKNYDNKDNGKKDTEDNNNTSSGQYTFDSSDTKEIMTGVGGSGGEGEDSTFILILINILLKTSRRLLKKRIVDWKKKKTLLNAIQNNQIIKMKIIN